MLKNSLTTLNVVGQAALFWKVEITSSLRKCFSDKVIAFSSVSTSKSCEKHASELSFRTWIKFVKCNRISMFVLKKPAVYYLVQFASSKTLVFHLLVYFIF